MCMFRFNPANKAEGKNPFTLDSKAPSASYRDFIMSEAVPQAVYGRVAKLNEKDVKYVYILFA